MIKFDRKSRIDAWFLLPSLLASCQIIWFTSILWRWLSILKDHSVLKFYLDDLYYQIKWEKVSKKRLLTANHCIFHKQMFYPCFILLFQRTIILNLLHVSTYYTLEISPSLIILNTIYVSIIPKFLDLDPVWIFSPNSCFMYPNIYLALDIST